MARLGDQLKAFAEKTKVKTETVVRKATLDMGGSMVEMSPVRSGRFRANWQYGGGAINTDTSQAPEPSGGAALGRIAAGVQGWKPGETIWITNSLPYAQRLETGWSKQAPAGFVRVTLANYQQYITDAIASTK